MKRAHLRPRAHCHRVASTPFTRALLAWFRRHRRDLPWRRIRTPYTTWISEVMLQQTVVAAVAPRFEAWLKRYPDARSLARAPLEEILRAWEGLGYYSRARNLHAAARLIATNHGGHLPDTLPALRALPGIGEYTAAAILSLAHGLPFPVLDANVKRVTQRLLAEPEWTPAVAIKARTFLEHHLSRRDPGGFNEAMMELGALVCAPRAPRCAECPVSSSCRGHELGIAALIPERRRRPVTTVMTTVIIAIHRTRVWLVESSHANRLPGPATTKPTPGSSFLQGLSAFPRLPAVTAAIATKVPDGFPLEPVTHSYLNMRETLRPILVRVPTSAAVTRTAGRWVPIAELEHFPMPSAYRRIARSILGLDTRSRAF